MSDIGFDLICALALVLIGANMVSSDNKNVFYGGIVIAITGAVLVGMTVVKYIVSGTV